jgi:hypothetical protein
MSHIVTIKEILVKDQNAVQEACRRLNLSEPVFGKTSLYGGNVEGLLIQLPNWTYPICCNLETGEIQYDNFKGNWGEQIFLDQFLQMYSVEKAKIEAERVGSSFCEEILENGDIVLEIEEGGRW